MSKGPFSEWFSRLPILELSAEVTTRTITNKDTHQQRQIRQQEGYLVQVDTRGIQLRRPVRFDLGADRAPYPPGVYILDGVSLNGNEWGDLELKRYGVRLLAVPPVVDSLLEQEAKRAA